MMKITSLTVAIASLIYTAQGAPMPAQGNNSSNIHTGVVGWQTTTGDQIPYTPITYPNTGEIWFGASHHNVTWDTVSIPRHKDYKNTAIFLGQNGIVISQEPLASNFSLQDGRVTVQTPKALNGDDFQIMLYSEHGNPNDHGSISENIAIVNVD